MARLSEMPETIGLVLSTTVVLRKLPTTLLRDAWLTDTPFVRPYVTANSDVLSDVSSTPPFAMNCCRFARPCQPRPGPMSSVCAYVPMFGVSGVFFHGIGLRHFGMP